MTSLDLVRLEAFMIGDMPLAELVQRPAWQRDALCLEYPRVNWFPQRGQPTEPAKMVCSQCLVRAECYEFAMGEPELTGVWGGTSENERRKIRSRAAA